MSVGELDSSFAVGARTTAVCDGDIILVDETEEDTLRKIFDSEAPPPPPNLPQQQQTKSPIVRQQQRTSSPKIHQALNISPSKDTSSQVAPRYIELKLGKRLTIQPDEERSLSIALSQRISAAERKKFRLSRHFDFFNKLQDRIAMTLELINGMNVQARDAIAHETRNKNKFRLKEMGLLQYRYVVRYRHLTYCRWICRLRD